MPECLNYVKNKNLNEIVKSISISDVKQLRNGVKANSQETCVLVPAPIHHSGRWVEMTAKHN